MYLVIFKPSRYEVRGLSYFYLSEFGLTQSGLKTTKNNSRTWIVGKGWFTLVAMCCESAAVRVFLEMQTTADSQMYSAKKIYSLRFLQDHEVFAYICWANFVLSA